MNILFLSADNPENVSFGGGQRTNLIWKTLNEIGDVYTVYYSETEQKQHSSKIWCVKWAPYTNPIGRFLFYCWKRIENKYAILQLGPMPYKAEKSISELYPNVKFDVVVARYLFDIAKLHLWNYPKVYVDIDDHPIEKFNTFLGQYLSPSTKKISRFLIRLQLRFFEGKMTAGWVSNANQTTWFHQKDLVKSLPNVTMPINSNYKKDAERKCKIITVGALSYAPNFMGVDKFITDVWLKLKHEYPQLEYHIIGKGTPESYSVKWQNIDGVYVRGFVEDLDKEYEECLAAVVPIYSGGGTCIKTLESMSHFRICLASPFGARGMDKAVNNQSIGLFVFNNASDFIKSMKDYVMNDEVRKELEKNAANYIEEHHSISTFKTIIKETLLTNNQ
jgi:glycosyltransferase involved in cell wall biosynthesis